MASNRRRKDKVVVVFDEKDRREFLTGFRKRKNERRKRAKEELKKKEEEKKKQLHAEKRKALQNHVQDISEEELDDDLESEGEVITSTTSTTHDFGEHTVTVSRITDEDMGRDFLSPIEASHRTVTDKTQHDDNQSVKPLPNMNGKTRDKLKRKFRKKAQKRKIQASNDKKSSKTKISKKVKR